MVWEHVRPVLDDVIGGLNEHDREAILLRFYEGRDYASVGARLNVADNTARMRVERALDNLREFLGITQHHHVIGPRRHGRAVHEGQRDAQGEQVQYLFHGLTPRLPMKPGEGSVPPALRARVN